MIIYHHILSYIIIYDYWYALLTSQFSSHHIKDEMKWLLEVIFYTTETFGGKSFYLKTEKYKKPCLRVPVSPSTVKNGVILNLAEASGRGTKWREISEIMPPNISPPPPPTPTLTESFPKQMCFARKVIFRHRRIFHSLPVGKSFSKQKCRKRKKHIKVLAAVDLQFLYHVLLKYFVTFSFVVI